MKNKYDAIIIGAGISGLTLGALLSKRNKKVLILEKNATIGGYCSSFERKNFTFDSSLHYVNGCYKGGSVYDILKECGVSESLQFVKPKYLCRSIFPDLDIKVPQASHKEFIEILAKIFPIEKIGLEQFFAEVTKIFSAINKLESNKVVSKNTIILNYANKTMKEFLDTFIKNKKLKALLSQYWVYGGLAPSKMPCLYYSYMWGDLVLKGAHYPKGGSQHMCDVLAEVIHKQNGVILAKNNVKKILIENKRAIGVVTAENKNFYSDNTISSIDAKFTFNNLLDAQALPHSYKKVVNKTKVSISAFKVYLGLDKSIKEIDGQDYEIFLNPSYNLDDQYKASVKNVVKNMPMGITVYSNLEDENSKNNTISLTVLSGYDYWKRLSRQQYKKKKLVIADKLIKRAEKILPSLTSKIKVIEIATPLTMERYTNNYHGAIYGWMKEDRRTSLKRLSQTTPIKNLYLTGNWARKGGGISGVMRSSKVVDRLIK